MRHAVAVLVLASAACGGVGGSGGGGPGTGGGAPSIEIVANGGELWLSTAGITIEVNVLAGGPPDSMTLELDGTAIATLDSSPWAFSISGAGMAEGTYELVAIATMDGEDPSISDPVALHVDTTRPTVTARSPAGGSWGVKRDAPVVVDFSEPIDPATATDGTVSVSDFTSGVALAKTLVLDPAATRLTITIHDAVVPSRLRVAATTGIRDRAGNALSDEPWDFRIGVWHCFGGEIAAQPGAQTEATRPVLLLGSAGAAVLSWQEYTTGLTFHTRRWNSLDATWEPIAAPLSAMYPGTQDMALDALGRPMLAWSEQPDGLDSDTRVARWNGSAWENLATFNEVSGFITYTTPSIVADSAGQPVVAWIEYDNLTAVDFQIYVARWNGVSWDYLDSPFEASSSIGGPEAPKLSRAPDGTIYLAWHERDPVEPHQNMYVAEWTDASWNVIGALNALPAVSSAQYGSIAIDPSSGFPVVSWHQTDGGVAQDIYVYRYDGDSWDPVGGPLSALPGTADAWFPSVAVGTDGRPAVAWSEDAIVTNVHGWQWNGSAWSTPAGVNSQPGSLFAGSPSLVVPPDGVPLVAFAADGVANEVSIQVCRENR